jgi:O-antigen/teichoic acid export membrane protein
MLWPRLKKMITTKPKLKELNLSQHLLGSFGLFIPQIAPRIYAILARTMLGIMATTTAVGFYENSDKIIRTILAVATGSGVVMLSKVSHVFIKGDHDVITKYLTISFELVAALSVPLTLGLMAVSQLFSHLFFGEEFDGIYQVLSILSLTSIFIAWSTVTGTQYLIPTNRATVLTRSLIIGITINFLLNLILIPIYGVKGAAYSTVVAEFSVVFQHLIFLRKEIIVWSLIKNIWKYFVSGLMMFVVIRVLKFTTPGVFALSVQVLVGVITYSICLIVLRTNAYFYVAKFIGIKNRKNELL